MTHKMILIAGVAAMAIAAPALADKGGHGGDGGGKPQQQAQQQAPQQRAQPQQAQQQHGHGGGGGGGGGQRIPRQQAPQQMQRAERPQQMQHMQRPQQVQRQQQRVERQAQRVERPQQMQRLERPQAQRQQQRIERQAQRVERPQQQQAQRQQQRVDRKQQRVERQAQRIDRPQQQRFDRQAQRVERQAQRNDSGVAPHFDRQQGKVDRRIADRNITIPGGGFDSRALRPSAPLFSTREMRPMKPFKQQFDNRQTVSIGQRIAPNYALAPVPAYVAGNYVDNSNYYYRYDDQLGSVYQIDRSDNVVRSLIPIFGGYNAGSPWPQTYYSSYVPAGYREYYYDTPDYYYRNDGYGIYQVDSSTQLITALVALISGQGLGIGQQLPASYDTYNVPLDYRDRYADDSDNWYRYGDGYIYRVDPRSRQIAARYPIYGGQYQYEVGQPWPLAYPDYNVPTAYRADYYDTPQYQYRYANGGIYQVNPTNQVILGLAALLSGDQFAIGQPLPAGYDTYNVPFADRDRYADSDRDWYRYANGTVYQVNPSTGLIEQAYPV